MHCAAAVVLPHHTITLFSEKLMMTPARVKNEAREGDVRTYIFGSNTTQFYFVGRIDRVATV